VLEMKKITGWWFAPEDKKLGNGDGRKIRLGTTHKVKGAIIPCARGLHLSKRIIDALIYASGPIIYKVEGSGDVVPHDVRPVDKYACSERTYIAGGIDVSDILRKFARLCALDVIHLWNAPDVVVEHLKTGKENNRTAAISAAHAVGWTVSSGSVASSAVLTAVCAAKYSVVEAAKYSAINSAVSVARGFDWGVLRDSASEAASKRQNKRLSAMVGRRLNQ
jgi:hypothetical protein